jgi:hypothetical protein
MSNFIYLLILIAIVAFLVYQRMTKQQGEPRTFPYRSKEFLLSPAERSFLGVLEQVLANTGYRLFAQVRLADVVQVEKGLSRAAWQSAFNAISRKHVDFVICRSDDMAIVGAIELDDKSHKEGKRKDRDVVLDQILDAAAIPLARFKAASAYTPKEIKSILIDQMKLSFADEVLAEIQEPPAESGNGDQSTEANLGKSPETHQDAEPNCPKCGSPLVARIAKKGKYQGQRFWGCSQFPNCQYVVKRP